MTSRHSPSDRPPHTHLREALLSKLPCACVSILGATWMSIAACSNAAAHSSPSAVAIGGFMNRGFTFIGRHLLVTCSVVAGLLSSPILTGRVSAVQRQEHAQSPRISCESLSGLLLNDGVMTSAVEVPSAGAIPGYCRVLATVEPETVRASATCSRGCAWQASC